MFTGHVNTHSLMLACFGQIYSTVKDVEICPRVKFVCGVFPKLKTKIFPFDLVFPHQTPAGRFFVIPLNSLCLNPSSKASCYLPFAFSEESFPLQVIEGLFKENATKCYHFKMSRCSFKWFTWLKAFLLFVLTSSCFFLRTLDSRLEGWISLPAKNTKRFGWDKKVTYPPPPLYLIYTDLFS